MRLLLLPLFVPLLVAQAKLEPRQQQVIAREQGAFGEIERAFRQGPPTLAQVAQWQGGIASLRANLADQRVPADHPQSAALLQRVVAFEVKLAAAEKVAAATAWRSVEAAFAELDRQLETMQTGADLRPWRERLDGIASFAATRQQDPQSQAATERIEALRARSEVKVLACQAGGVADARAPEDLYEDGDRAALEQRLREAWAQTWPKDEVLAVRFPMAGWRREQTTAWIPATRSWRHTDQSVLEVAVVVRSSPTEATLFRASLRKDHLDQDALSTAVDPKDGAAPARRMLVKNLPGPGPSGR